MTQKAAYLWGPISSFSGPLAAWLLQNGWQVHIPTKSALNIFSLSPLELRSAAQSWLERALGGRDQLKTFQERLQFVESGDIVKGTTYDALIFCPLPPNFDEPRTPRAPWAAGELPSLSHMLKGVPTFIVSSLWAGVQPDGVVPEELEFERRKPLSNWEGICQQYEQRILEALSAHESPWHLVRLPLLTGDSRTGKALNFSGMYTLLRELTRHPADGAGEGAGEGTGEDILALGYNPDASLPFLPVDTAVVLVWRLLEDGLRPRICNLVPTESTLNREWLQLLGKALGYQRVEPSRDDPHSLPGVLRKMLTDSVLVKTRNLFEVAGRYHHLPVRLDESYFASMLEFGRSERWGKPGGAEQAPSPVLTEELARAYFEEFLQQKERREPLKEVTRGGAVGFYLTCPEPVAWQVKEGDSGVAVERIQPDSKEPRLRVYCSGDAFFRVATGQVPLHRALLSRQLRLEGPVVELFQFAGAYGRFTREHPFEPAAAAEEDASLSEATRT